MTNLAKIRLNHQLVRQNFSAITTPFCWPAAEKPKTSWLDDKCLPNTKRIQLSVLKLNILTLENRELGIVGVDF